MSNFSGAKYNGDFTMTLEEAQEAKHRIPAIEVEFASLFFNMPG